MHTSTSSEKYKQGFCLELFSTHTQISFSCDTSTAAKKKKNQQKTTTNKQTKNKQQQQQKPKKS